MNKETQTEKNLLEDQMEKPKEKELLEEINHLREEKLHLLADRENQRKNYQQNNEYIKNYSNKRIILWLLDFLADLERALEFMRQEPEAKVKNHLLAIEMMKDNCWKNLENEGVKEIKIETEKDQLNSRYQEVVAEIENNNFPSETILEVVAKGYLLYEQVLKASQVKISKKNSREKEKKEDK